MSLLLSPHNDDETLFAAYAILAGVAHVRICLRSQVQEDRYGITAATREKETGRALWWLGCSSWDQGTVLDNDPYVADALFDDFKRLKETYEPELVWAPAVEEGGHEHHTIVGMLALDRFGPEVVRPYLTYRRGHMRTKGRFVEIEPGWKAKKLRALACYESQIELDNTSIWFTDDALNEYTPW